MSRRYNKFENREKDFNSYDDRTRDDQARGREKQARHLLRSALLGNHSNHARSSVNNDLQKNNNVFRRMHLYEKSRGRGKVSQPPPKSYMGWNYIVVKNVEGADRDEVISTITKNVSECFSPVLGKFSNLSTFSFFVEDNRGAANAMLHLSNRLTLDSGQKLKIYVFENVPSFIKPSPKQLDILKQVMSNRYDAEKKHINLQAFNKDPVLIQEDVYMPLSVYEALTIVVNIIKENIPQVKEIDLSNNKIYNPAAIEAFRECQNLRISFEKNRISKYMLLGRLKKVDIIEINLKENPIHKSLNALELYRSTMVKMFPKLQYLDGIKLPEVPGFDVIDTAKIPPILGSQYASEEVMSPINKFLEEYYQVYKQGENRRLLEAAYAENGCFSLCCAIPENVASSWDNARKFFHRHNRSLTKCLAPKKRHTNLIQGNDNIVNFLCEMPLSFDDPQDFIIDVPIALPELIHVCVRGVCMVVEGSTSTLLGFSQSLIIVQVGTGMCIANEEFFVSLPSPEQKQKQNKKPVINSLPATSSAVGTFNGLEPIQIKMVEQFSHHSRMYPQFSRECLENHDWEFNKAAEVFMTLQNENKIPSEYFVN